MKRLRKPIAVLIFTISLMAASLPLTGCANATWSSFKVKPREDEVRYELEKEEKALIFLNLILMGAGMGPS